MSTPRILLLAAAFWALFGIVAGLQVWLSMLDHGHNVPLLLSHFLLIWLAWWLPSILIGWLSRRFPVVPPSARSVTVHAVAATLIGVLHAAFCALMVSWLRPYDRMTAHQSIVFAAISAQLPLELILYCLVLGCVLAIEFYGRYRERALQAAELERSLADARLHALELQLQPHFLFNTLNAITTLVRSGRKDEAVTMIAGLGELLRYSLDHAGRQQVPLAEELAVLERYLEIQQVRFPDRLRYRIEAAEACRHVLVPILILQPLAENAVRHGIALSPGELRIHVARNGERLQIELHNPGRLAASAERIGLANTRERLRHLYGDQASFSLVEIDGGVRASLLLPWKTS